MLQSLCRQRRIAAAILLWRNAAYRPASTSTFNKTDTPYKMQQNAKEQSDSESENEGFQQNDEFTQQFLKNRIETTTFQRFLLSMGSPIAAILNPRRHDMIACLGETTGERALRKLQREMLESSEGAAILKDKPRINTHTVDLDLLQNLPQNTFGYAYAKFLKDNNVTPDSRLDVRFMDDPELAYIMTRYRECHDLIHAILNMPTNMLGEVAVKWVEALNIGLPMCYGGAIFGALRLRPKQRKDYVNRYLPWAIRTGRTIKPLMPIYWEKRWGQDASELRKELGIGLILSKQRKPATSAI